MDLKEHEKWIKKELQKKIPTLDTNALWDEMEQHVPSKKNKYLLFFLIPLGFLVILGLGWSITTQENTHKIQHSNQEVKKKIQINDLYKDIETAQNSPNTHYNQNSLLNDSNEKNKKPKRSIESINIASSDVNPNASKKSLNIKNQAIILSNATQTSGLKSHNESKEKTEITKDNLHDVKKEKYHELSFDKNVMDQFQNLQDEILKYPTLTTPTLTLLRSLNSSINQPTNFPVLTPLKSKFKRKLIWRFQSGINYGNEDINSQSSLTKTYKDITRRMPGYSAMLWMEIPLKNRLSLTGGVSTSQLIHQISFKYVDRVESSDYGILSYVINKEGSTEQVNGTIKTYEETNYEGTWYSNKTDLALNFGVSFSIVKKNRWQLLAQGGAISTIYSKTRGSILGERSESLIIQEANNKWNTTFQVQPYGGMEIQYHVSTKTSIGLQYQYTRQNNTNSLQINTRNSLHTIGLNCAYSIYY